MKELKKLGIFMDHAHANVMEYNTENLESTALDKHSINHGEQHNSDMGEHKLNNKENTEQHSFYHKLSEIIKDQDEVLLFGPTNAKTELLHMLRADQHFSHIKIELKNADKLTENQQHAFVKDHFKK